MNVASNKTEEPKAITTPIKAGTPNENNATFVDSKELDENMNPKKVPVPNGYVASPLDEEKYINGVNEPGVYYLTYNSDVTLTPASDTYPWTETDGIWKSGNKGQKSTSCTLNSADIVVGSDGGKVRINASVSSEANFDILNITVKNKSTGASVNTEDYSGTSYGTVETSLTYFTKEVELEEGTYTVTIKYTKDSGGDKGLDTAYVKSVKLYTKGETGEEEVHYTKRVHSGGFVIYERLTSDEGKTDEQVQEIIRNDIDIAQRTRNQFVWVPIEDVKDMYHPTTEGTNQILYANEYSFNNVNSPYAKSTTSSTEPKLQTNGSAAGSQYDYDHGYLKPYLEGISRNELQQEMREEFAEMLKSVATYGGFYIGRYETGNTQKNNLRVVKGYTGTESIGNANNQINYITWYDAYKRSRAMRGKNPVQTSLIWGIQWDETLVWLMKLGEKTPAEVITDSTSWGNYSNATRFTYTKTSGLTADGTGTVAGGTSTKNTGSTIVPTGSTERNKANNIYDLAGNMNEWTMETYSYVSRYRRGGSSNGNGTNSPASSRNSDYPSNSSYYSGTRATLCIHL